MTGDSGAFDPTAYPRVYRVSLRWKIFLYLSGVVLSILGAWCLTYVFSRGPAVLAAPVFALGSVGVILILVGVWQVLSGVRRKIVLTSTAIEVRGVLASQTLPRNEIAEYQFNTFRDDTTLTVLPQNKSLPTIRASVLFDIDDLFRAWFVGIQDPTAEPVPPLRWRNMSILHRASVAWAVFACVSFFWKIFAGKEIFISPNCLFAFIFPAIVAGAFAWIAFARLISAGTATKDPRFARYRAMSSTTKYFFLPLIFAGFIGIWPITAVVPSLLVRATGSEYEATYVVIRTERERGRGGSCNHVFTRDLAEYWFGAICVSDGQMAGLRPGDKIEVEGLKSRFGVAVEKIL
jgi:hypothetical protein